MELLDGNLIIHVPKEIDHCSAEKIKYESDRFFAAGHVKNVIFDMSDVEFMDSSGIGMILGRYMSGRYIGGRVAVAAVPARVDRVLGMSGVYKVVEKYDNIMHALKKCIG